MPTDLTVNVTGRLRRAWALRLGGRIVRLGAWVMTWTRAEVYADGHRIGSRSALGPATVTITGFGGDDE